MINAWNLAWIIPLTATLSAGITIFTLAILKAGNL